MSESRRRGEKEIESIKVALGVKSAEPSVIARTFWKRKRYEEKKKNSERYITLIFLILWALWPFKGGGPAETMNNSALY